MAQLTPRSAVAAVLLSAAGQVHIQHVDTTIDKQGWSLQL